MSLDFLGANTEIGFTADMLGPIFQAAGGLTTGIVNTVKQVQDEKKLTEKQTNALKASIAADMNAATAMARATVSAKLNSQSAAKDKRAADAAVAAADQAGSSSELAPDAQAARAQSARGSLNAAIAAAQAAGLDVYKDALVDAWTAIVNKANNATIVSKSPEGGTVVPPNDGGSFLTKKVIGPVNVWQAGAGALVAGLLAKKFLIK